MFRISFVFLCLVRKAQMSRKLFVHLSGLSGSPRKLCKFLGFSSDCVQFSWFGRTFLEGRGEAKFRGQNIYGNLGLSDVYRGRLELDDSRPGLPQVSRIIGVDANGGVDVLDLSERLDMRARTQRLSLLQVLGFMCLENQRGGLLRFGYIPDTYRIHPGTMGFCRHPRGIFPN